MVVLEAAAMFVNGASKNNPVGGAMSRDLEFLQRFATKCVEIL